MIAQHFPELPQQEHECKNLFRVSTVCLTQLILFISNNILRRIQITKFLVK
jgi:hypothetical protein